MKEDKEYNNMLHWSDEKLANEVRALANHLLNKEIKGYASVTMMASIFNLVNGCVDANAGSLEMTITDFSNTTIKPEEKRSFKITVEEI